MKKDTKYWKNFGDRYVPYFPDEIHRVAVALTKQEQIKEYNN